MKANELMIGDWVRKGNLFGQVFDIEQRKKFAIVGVELVGNGYDVYNDNELEPIQLTPEILEKNFPTAGELAWWPVEDGLHCESRNTEDIMVSGVFRFVHQLQSALRLVGIEKEIKL